MVWQWCGTWSKNKKDLRNACLSIFDITSQPIPPTLSTLNLSGPPLSGWPALIVVFIWSMALVYSPRKEVFSWILPHTLTRHLPQSWLSWNGILQKTQETLNRTTHWPVTFADGEIRHLMFIGLRHTQTNAPVLRTSSALCLPAPTYMCDICDEENSMSAWICVHGWSLSNLAWQSLVHGCARKIRWALISYIFLLNTFVIVCLCVVQWELIWYVPHPTTAPLIHLFGDGLQRGQQCEQARSVVICLCV